MSESPFSPCNSLRHNEEGRVHRDLGGLATESEQREQLGTSRKRLHQILVLSAVICVILNKSHNCSFCASDVSRAEWPAGSRIPGRGRST